MFAFCERQTLLRGFRDNVRCFAAVYPGFRVFASLVWVDFLTLLAAAIFGVREFGCGSGAGSGAGSSDFRRSYLGSSEKRFSNKIAPIANLP